MGRQLSTTKELKSTPVVNVRAAAGQKFVGVLQGYKQVKSPYKAQDGSDRFFDVFTFAVEESNMPIVIKNGKEYVEANVVQGDTVSVFAPTRLAIALLKATVGERIQFVYEGLVKAGKRGGKAHNYKVEVL